jgi:branched-chain amino acid transport system ATP-binding protein
MTQLSSVPASASEVLLQVNQLSRNFGGLAALRDVTFSVSRGEIVGLIGPNGAGKTTAFNVISGTMPPSSGTVIFDGQDISGGPPSKVVVGGLARTFQSTSTYPEVSVAENIYRGMLSRLEGTTVARLTGRRTGLLRVDQVDSEIDAILDQVDMQAWRDVPAGSLAYGLQKKLGIAVALASRPTILLLDEPAAGLNHEECNELGRLLKHLQQQYGLTLLLVEHHMALVMDLCERIVVLVQGKKIAEGTPLQIRENPAVIEAYLGAPDYAHA